MQRNLRHETRIVRVKGCRVRRVVNVVQPDPFRQIRIEHRRVLARVDRAESRADRAHAQVAIHLEVENLHGQRISRLRALDVERPGERVIPVNHAERIGRLLDRIAEAVERIGVENVSRFKASDGLGRAEEVFHRVDSCVIANVGGLLGSTENRKWREQNNRERDLRRTHDARH